MPLTNKIPIPLKKKNISICTHTDKYIVWSIHGLNHRTDGPAIESTNGRKEWWLYGQKHRSDGPAIECLNGRTEWWFKGRRHRMDGPAIETPNGKKEWWFKGLRHRIDGPAIEGPDEKKEWWEMGICIKTTHNKKYTVFNNNNEMCSICLENDVNNWISLQCKHQFHLTCVDPWLVKHKNCPLCRKNTKRK